MSPKKLLCADGTKPDVPELLAQGRMLAAADPYQRSLSMHPAVLRLDTRDAWPEPWFRFAMLQQGHLVNNTGSLLAQLRAAVSAAKGMPVVNSEANYVRQHTVAIRRCPSR